MVVGNVVILILTLGWGAKFWKLVLYHRVSLFVTSNEVYESLFGGLHSMHFRMHASHVTTLEVASWLADVSDGHAKRVGWHSPSEEGLEEKKLIVYQTQTEWNRFPLQFSMGVRLHQLTRCESVSDATPSPL